MKNLLKVLLSAFIFFATAPTAQARDSMAGAGMEEIKKKKKKGKKIKKKGKKKKKGFFSKFKGAK